MTRLLHLTDLHFGTERADLIAPLRAAIAQCAPDLVAVSGDLTHRARPGQFRAAMAFLESLGLPFITAPGNHDIPLWNLPLRLLAPFRPWRRGVAARWRGPEALAGDFRVFTTNTADPMRIRPGVLRAAEIDRIARALRKDGPVPGRLNVLLCHHPLEEPPGFDRGETRNAVGGMMRLEEAGLHIVLSGHLHHWQIGLGVTSERPRALLQIQSGTALCARMGEKDHGFSLLESGADGVTVTPWKVDEALGQFQADAPIRFSAGPDGWLRCPEAAHSSP